MAISTEKNKDSGKVKREKNLIPWEPGQSGNPEGRKPGQRNYRTIYLEALKRIAALKGYSVEEIEDAMTVKAIEKAIKGDFFFYKDVNDRIHGKPKDTIDLGSGGRSLAELIATANANSKRTHSKRGATPKATGKNKK